MPIPTGFADLDEGILARLVREAGLAGRQAVVSAGTVLHRPGAPAASVHFIRSGEVRLYQMGADGGQRLLEILGAGEWFGAEAMGQLAQYGSLAKAMTNATVFTLPSSRLLAALPRHPDMSLEIIRQLAARLSVATDEGSRLTFDDCRHRLIKMLLKFSRSAAATVIPDGVVLRITHEQLAQAVGAARETVSLALTQLRHEKIIVTGRNKLTFNPRQLRAALYPAPIRDIPNFPATAAG